MAETITLAVFKVPAGAIRFTGESDYEKAKRDEPKDEVGD